MHLLKKILNQLHPVLKPLSQWYLSKPRSYSYKNINVAIYPSVFHPGLFFSTKVFIEYLENRSLNNLHILELGAGSGLISIYCNKRGAVATASDINDTALQNIKSNCQKNDAKVTILKSDLFEKLDPKDFDLILINPPYYPKAVLSNDHLAWHCGEHFEYFERLFSQLEKKTSAEVLMILSEDCDLNQIFWIAAKHNLKLDQTYAMRKSGEMNYIFRIKDE